VVGHHDLGTWWLQRKDGTKLAGLGELSDADVGCGVAGEEENGEGDERS
jgi:hypothetical protein